MARKMSNDTQTKQADKITKFGLPSPRIEMPADSVVWGPYNDELRECTIFKTIVVQFRKNGEGKWAGAFPMLGTTNASKSKVQTPGYVTEEPGDFDKRVDHLAISLGRQLFSVAELVMSTDVADTGVAALKAENAQLVAATNAANIAASVMQIVYQGEDDAGNTVVTQEMWDVLPQKLQERIAGSDATREHVPAGAKYRDGNDVFPSETPAEPEPATSKKK